MCLNWLNVESDNNWLVQGQSESISVHINPIELEMDSYYSGQLIITSNVNSIPFIIPIHLHTLGNSILGDLNVDGLINILDVIFMVNLILDEEYNFLGDLDIDGTVNIFDIVQLINQILDS